LPAPLEAPRGKKREKKKWCEAHQGEAGQFRSGIDKSEPKNAEGTEDEGGFSYQERREGERKDNNGRLERGV
jgi:hypothetical protein